MDDFEFMLEDRIAKIQAINEYKQCLHLWKPVYDEYIRIGYRLKKYPHEEGGEK